jgi:hypothetical protein
MFDLMQYALIFYDFQLILAQMRYRPEAFSHSQGLLTPRVRTPFSIFQLLVFLP